MNFDDQDFEKFSLEVESQNQNKYKVSQSDIKEDLEKFAPTNRIRINKRAFF